MQTIDPFTVDWLMTMGYPFLDRRLALIRDQMRVADRKGDTVQWDRLTLMEAETIEARIRLHEGGNHGISARETMGG